LKIFGVAIRKSGLEATARVLCESDVEEITIEAVLLRNNGQVQEIVDRDSKTCYATDRCDFKTKFSPDPGN
jgi:hypothetical protein